jgi:cytidine deaminase
MTKGSFQFEYEKYASLEELNEDDRALLKKAHEAASFAYAPYSDFKVGAAAEMQNGEIITGSNQENVSFPAGLCAEGVVMAAAASKFPGMPIRRLAITYQSSKENNSGPIAPCGICRQSLQEFKERTNSPVKLIMGAINGSIIVVNDASSLMPFSFRF